MGQRLNHAVGNALALSSAFLSAKSVQSADYRIFASLVPFCSTEKLPNEPIARHAVQSCGFKVRCFPKLRNEPNLNPGSGNASPNGILPNEANQPSLSFHAGRTE